MKKLLLLVFVLCIQLTAWTQIESAPERTEGEGPWSQLIIRGVTLINGNGAPPTGPVDIVVEENKITEIKTVGYPGIDIQDANRPKLKPGGKELDASGMYLMPGFIDMHGHIGGEAQGVTAEYVFKLWMGHGVTTIEILRLVMGWTGCWNTKQNLLKIKSQLQESWHIPLLVKAVNPR